MSVLFALNMSLESFDMLTRKCRYFYRCAFFGGIVFKVIPYSVGGFKCNFYFYSSE
jgi:hypothetical protein